MAVNSSVDFIDANKCLKSWMSPSSYEEVRIAPVSSAGRYYVYINVSHAYVAVHDLGATSHLLVLISAEARQGLSKVQ